MSFFCHANMYRPSLGKVQLGRPNPKPIQPLIFLSQKKKKTLLRMIPAIHKRGYKFKGHSLFPIFIKYKKNILLRIARTTMLHCATCNFHIHLFLKTLIFSKKPVKILNYIYYNY